MSMRKSQFVATNRKVFCILYEELPDGSIVELGKSFPCGPRVNNPDTKGQQSVGWNIVTQVPLGDGMVGSLGANLTVAGSKTWAM